MKLLLAIALLGSAALLCNSLLAQIVVGGQVPSVVFDAFLTGLCGAFLRAEFKRTRRPAPTPLSVSEGCGSNHREEV